MPDIKKQLQWSKLKVGSIITLALLIVLAAVLFTGNLKDLFLEKVEIKSHFRDVEGLRKGDPVWLFGTEVGSVRQIALNPAYGTVVIMSVNKSILPFVKEDSTAVILTMGLLGDKYIAISAGSPEARPVRSEEMIEGVAQIGVQNVMKASSSTIEAMNKLMVKLDDLVSRIDQGQGTIAKLLNDPSLYNNLNRSAQTLSQVTEEIRSSHGTLKKLIEDPTLYNRFEALSGRLEAWARKLQESQGTLEKLIKDPTLYNDLTKGTKQMSAILEQIDKGEGLASALLKNRDLVRELSETLVQLKKTAANIEAFTTDIKTNPKKFLKFSIF